MCALLLLAALAGCSAVAPLRVPPELAHPPTTTGRLFVLYNPHALLGFGHTGLVVQAPDGTYVFYEQLASSEVALNRHQEAGTVGWLEPVTARLRAAIGTTREVVFRHEAPSPADFTLPGQALLPVPVDDAGLARIRAAAEARFQTADGLEQPTARRYFILTNTCTDFVWDVVSEGQRVPDRYFPKHLAAALLAEYRERQQTP